MNNFLEVNINNILYNLNILKKSNPKKEICIPIKANAYGVGYDIAGVLIKNGYNFFGVSTLEEASYIRSISKEAKILLFSAIFKENIQYIKENKIMITVYDFEMLNLMDSNIKFHIKFDIGMGRLGFLPSQLKKVKTILKHKKLNPIGIYTHLPDSEDEVQSVNKINEFEEIITKLKGFDIKYIHYANGVASLKYDTNFDNLIRPGLVIYGYFDSLDAKNKICKHIKPSCSLKVRCSHIKDYKGEVGYLGTDYVNGEIGTFSLGYHDGLKQSYKGYEITNVGKIVGKICMCQFMLLIDQNKTLQKGQYIYFFEEDDIYKLSEFSGVSVYEILATLGPRIKRIYKGE